MHDAPVIDYYTQTEAAQALGWTRQRLWVHVHAKLVASVVTRGERQTLLIPGSEIARLQKPEGKRGKR